MGGISQCVSADRVSKGAFPGLAERAVTASEQGSQRDGEREQLQWPRDPHSFTPQHPLGSCDETVSGNRGHGMRWTAGCLHRVYESL